MILKDGYKIAGYHTLGSGEATAGCLGHQKVIVIPRTCFENLKNMETNV